MGTLLLPLLQARGLDPTMSVGIGMIIGPSQVGARLVEMLAGRRYSPIWIGSSGRGRGGDAARRFSAGSRHDCIVRSRQRRRVERPRHGPINTVRPRAIFGLDGTIGSSLMIAMAFSPSSGG